MDKPGRVTWYDARGQEWPWPPPPGWWQANDGCWYPPSRPGATPPRVTQSAGARLLGVFRSWPMWAQVAAATAAVVLVLGGIGSLAAEAPADDPEPAAQRSTQTTAKPSTTTTSTTTSTTAPPATLPPTTVPVATVPPATVPPPTLPPPPVTSPPEPEPPPASVYYANCDAVRAAGAAPLYRGDPGYASHLDRDDDGVACE